MIAINQNKKMPESRLKKFNGFLLLFASAAVFAQAGLVNLPSTYRTPLSDMVYDDLTEWRAEPKEDNPWREGEEDLIVKPRMKIEFFPQYNYDSIETPISDSLFQNEYEIEKPAANILEYSF